MRPASSIETLPAVGVWRLRSVGLVLAIVIAAAFVPGRLAAALAVNARDAQQDFGIFYRGAHCLHDAGCDPYGGADQSAPNLAPPHAHLLLAPVIWLSRPAAYAAWLALSVFILAIVIIRVTRQLSMSFTPLGWLLIAMIVAGSGLMMSLVTSGQIYAVLTWPITEAWIAWRQNRLSRAAFLVGAAASVKVLLLLPILWFVARGQWRPALVMATTVGAFFGLGVVLFGVSPHLAWLDMLSHAPVSGHFRDGAIMAALTRSFGDSTSFAPLMDAPGVIQPVWAGIVGVVIAGALLTSTDADRTVLALLAAATLTAPIGWIYSAWWFIGPGLAVWVGGSKGTRRALAVAGMLLWLPDTFPLSGQPNRWLTLLVGSAFFWVWVLVWSLGVFSRHPD